MQRPLTPHTPTTHASSSNHLRICGAIALAALVLGVAALGPLGGAAAPPTAPSNKEPTVGDRPLFDSWPGKGGQKPDAAIILTGQTFGLLQPCGCSRPQKGGLERRMQFIQSLRAKQWPVAGVDLGDIYPEKVSLQDQGLLRYKTTMLALRQMGYLAVGLGKTDFAAEIDKILGEYAYQNDKEQPPFILAGNLMGNVDGKPVPREKHWPSPGKRPLIGLAEVAQVGGVTVGVAGIVGKSLADEVELKKLDTNVTFVKNGKGKVDNAPVLKAAVNALKKAQLNVLIYQGTSAEAEALAKDWPDFHVILCQADDAEPPQAPTPANGGRTLIVQVGHKGRYAGVLGVFRKNGGFDLHYQLVPFDEYYITRGEEAEAEKTNPILPLLAEYSKTVRDTKTASGGKSFLQDWPRGVHPAQVAQKQLTYVGSDACKDCHAAEHALWAKSPHGHALDTLEKVATRPTLRNYDPECVRCHTVGFNYQSGYVDEKKTPHLKHVGCENCHGPGSGHVQNPKAKQFLDLMSPWRAQGGGKLPADLLKQLADAPPEKRGQIAIAPAQQIMIATASRVCADCHDPDNDPHFVFEKYWPKVNHTGLAPPGGWPAVAPKNAAVPPKK